MRIFVSSTFKDLRPERESAQEALRRSELVPWGMELFVSEPSKPLDVCLEQVQLSDAVILIIGFMAGSLIPESPELTYTRAEFELAQRLGRPVFAFFKTEGGVPVNKETDADKKKALDDFKNAVTSAGITPAYFDSPDRLTVSVLCPHKSQSAAIGPANGQRPSCHNFCAGLGYHQIGSAAIVRLIRARASSLVLWVEKSE